MITSIVNYADPEGGFSGILCVQSVTTAIVLKQRSMNKPHQVNSQVRVVVDTSYLVAISQHRSQDVAPRTSLYWMINDAAIVIEKVAAGVCLFTRDQEKLESRPLI